MQIGCYYLLMHIAGLGGYVLAGGNSRRMGRDKALLPHHFHSEITNETMLERTCRLICEVAGNVTVLGPAHRYAHLGLATLEDIIPNCGPLGGIHAALTTTPYQRILIAPVDLPNLTTAFLQQLVREQHQCVIAAGQPLCGVYHRDCLPSIADALHRGMLKVTACAKVLHAFEIVPDDPQTLENRNTPEDWRNA